MRIFFILFIVSSLATSCSTKADKLEAQLELKDEQLILLENQLENLKATNGSLLDRMSDLSIVSKSGAESIQKSLESLSKQYGFIQNLTQKIQSKDSLNLALVMNLKRSLMDINDEDVQVEVRGGVVHISISDKMLFRSGSDRLNNQAQSILGKIASVINDHSQLEIVVEGHTDNVPINNEQFEDNWDLSVNRATEVVRVLQLDYLVDPERLTAAGRSKYHPKAENTTSLGRSQNRRTEIILQPRMDQFFQLLESPDLEG
jgi:chemotaxis protein MotB